MSERYSLEIAVSGTSKHGKENNDEKEQYKEYKSQHGSTERIKQYPS